jgi:hypothetical protein
MFMRKILCILLLILGTGSFAFGSFLSHRASLGANQISQKEEELQEHRKPLVGPIRKSIDANSTEKAQEKISGKKQKLVRIQVRANWFRGTGIVLFVAGLACFFFRRR